MPAARSRVTDARHRPVPSQLASVTFCVIAGPPTRGFTFTSTIVPAGTPSVARSIAAGPGVGIWTSMPPYTPCGAAGTGWPATDVTATVGAYGLTSGPGVLVRTATGSVRATFSAFVNDSSRIEP